MPLIVYKSSAGSGKTYTLVREYLRLLILNPSAFRNILAVTFTNKATAEMKSRILSALNRLSTGSFNDLEESLLQDLYGNFLHTNADREKYILQIRTNARQALQNILHSYSEFSISTIDSFFQKILRNFTKELKLPMRYELEMDTEFALDEIVVQLMQEVGHDKELTKWLEDFTFAQIDEDKGWDITQTITQLGKEIFKEEVWESLSGTKVSDNTPPMPPQPGPANPDDEENLSDNNNTNAERQQRYEQLKHLIKEIEKLKHDFEEDMAAFGKQALELIAGHGLKPADFKPGTAVFFEKIAKKEIPEPSDTLRNIVNGNTQNWRAQNSGKKEKIDQLVHHGGLQNLLQETFNYYDTQLPAYHSAAEVLKNVYVYAILHDLKDKLRSYRTEKNLMLISDTNNVLRAVISGDNTPFVYEKVGIVYRHLLIDEFQDTSTYQWKNLLPLVENALSEEQHTVLIVGDVKQSIYRWRGGNLQLLLKDIAKDLKNFFTAKTEKDLTDNYRSAKHIIDFNNAFFETATGLLVKPNEPDHLHRAYAKVKQGIIRQEGGYVSVKLFADQKEDGKTTGWKEQARAALLAKIQELQQQQCRLHNMAILVRTNAEGSEIAQFLNEYKIPVISSEALLLKNSVKVQLLIAALHYMANANNTIAKTEILVNYLTIHNPQYPPDHRVFADHLHGAHNPNALFNQLLPPNFETNLQNFAQKPLYECVEMLLQLLQLNTEPDAYVQRFQDLILEFSRSQSADVGHFLEWWQENKDRDKTSVIVPEGENAVTIMTIHKAKGLEFPVVFIPYADWNMKPDKAILWTETDTEPFKQLGAIPLHWSSKVGKSLFIKDFVTENLHALTDNMNLLYVAFTRPTEELYIFSKMGKTQTTGELPDRIYKLLFATLGSFAYQLLFNAGEGCFEYGQPANWALFESKKAQTMQPLTTYLSHDYRSKITLRSDSDRFFMLFDNAASEAIKLGQKIHSVLEKLIGPQDIDKVIRKLQIQGLLTAADEQPIKQRLSQIFALPQVQQWFSPQWEVLAERTLLCNNQQRKPDRVIIHQNQAVIIDYKTGKSDAKHHRQLNIYAQWLEAMGYTIGGKYLLYISETDAEVVEVTGK